MADSERHLFGLHMADYVYKVTEGGTPLLQGGATAEFWVDRNNDTQYVGFTADKEGTSPLEAVVTSSGGGGYQLGDLTAFYGPPGVLWMFASVDGGPRKIIWCSDLAEIVEEAVSSLLFQGRGDLLVGTGPGTYGRLAAGSNGRQLITDDTQETGLRWQLPTTGDGSSGITGASDTLWVAASNAPDDFGEGDYHCDGTADEAQINLALANPYGLKVALSPGTFNLAAPVALLGNDNATIPLSRSLRGCGTSTVLAAGAGLATAILLTAAVCPQISDLSITVTGATHGVQSVQSATPAAGKRSFWRGEIRNLSISGPGNGTHTGWAMHLGAGFRYTVSNVEALGVGNGVRVLNQDSTFAAGSCEFRRINVDVIGTGAVGFNVSSPSGGANEIVFDTCYASAAAASTGTVGWKFDGAGTTSGVRVRNSTAEQFDTAISITATAYDIDVDLTKATMTTGGVFASVAGYGCKIRCGALFVPASATISAITETNSLAARPNEYSLDTIADTDAVVNATLTSGIVVRGAATGAAAGNVDGRLRRLPVRWQPHLFANKGTVTTTGTGGYPIWNNSGVDVVLRSAQVSLRTATATGSFIVDINIGGVSIFTDPANRPRCTAGQTTSGKVTTAIVGVIWPAGAAMTVDIDGFGDGTATDPAVQIDTY